jgi:hypothetical protein
MIILCLDEFKNEFEKLIRNNSYSSIETDVIKNARKKITEYFKALGDANNVYVQINGDIIGYHNNPLELYTK